MTAPDLTKLLQAVERLVQSPNTELRPAYERSFADTDALRDVMVILEDIQNG